MNYPIKNVLFLIAVSCFVHGLAKGPKEPTEPEADHRSQFGITADITKAENRELNLMSKKLVIELVANRCPSQLQKTEKHFILVRDVQAAEKTVEEKQAEDPLMLNEKVVYNSELKAMETADLICEGSVDDVGPSGYEASMFRYKNFKQLMNDALVIKQKKEAEMNAAMIAESAYKEAIEGKMDPATRSRLQNQGKESSDGGEILSTTGVIGKNAGSFGFGNLVLTILVLGAIGWGGVKAYVAKTGDQASVDRAVKPVYDVFNEKILPVYFKLKDLFVPSQKDRIANAKAFERVMGSNV